MPALENPRHERFAQAVASGKSASEAYRQSGGNGKNADCISSRLSVKVGIRKRVAELKAAASEKSEMSRDDLIAFLCSVILTPSGKVDKNSVLCQSHKDTVGEKYSTHEIKMPDKLGAVVQLAKLCGWNEAEKHELGAASELAEVLRRLRGS